MVGGGKGTVLKTHWLADLHLDFPDAKGLERF
jgi:hypothetical protein